MADGNADSVIIAPSLLAADFSNLPRAVRQAEEGGAQWLHLDVMDGHFVPNITFGPLIVAAVRSLTDLPLDVHLMIAPPEPYLADFARAGADRLTVHAEATPHLHRALQAIGDLGLQAGVALNPATPWSGVRWVLDQVDLVLAMTVNPGFGGQAFLSSVMPKVTAIRDYAAAQGRAVHIQVDGGIDLASAPLAVAAGADVLVAGSAVYGASDPAAAIRALRQVGSGTR